MKTMQVRQHRGSLEASMATAREIEASHEALVAWAHEVFGEEIAPDAVVQAEPYGYDVRISKYTHIILINGRAYGFIGMDEEGAPFEVAHGSAQ